MYDMCAYILALKFTMKNKYFTDMRSNHQRSIQPPIRGGVGKYYRLFNKHECG